MPEKVVILVTIAQLSDIFQYFIGKISKCIGIARPIGWISPKKTMEGYLFTLLFLPMCYNRVINFTYNEEQPFIWIKEHGDTLFVYEVILYGMIGGLISSLFKRITCIKDYSTLLGPHGGWIDRIDSIYFSVILLFF